MRRLGLLLLLAASAPAFGQEQVRYVTDELAIALREGPRGDAATRGVLTSGARVVLLESRAGAGYARVRTGDGREAWIQEKYLVSEPIARSRLDRAEKDLAAAQAELKKLREDHARLLEDFARISGGEPVAEREVLAEAEALRQQLAETEERIAALRARAGSESARQRTLLLGGALVFVGGLLALLLRWLWPKRRWGEL
ncbi:MAG: TIGR04211 family SH3 domain-containing protein [Nevskiaceae bacterium]